MGNTWGGISMQLGKFLVAVRVSGEVKGLAEQG